MSGEAPGAEPAGGTTTRSSAGRAGRSILEARRATRRRTATTTELPKAYAPARRRGRDLRALAGRGRLRARRRRLARRPGLPPFTIIQPPPNVTGSLHLGHAQRTARRGPDDPPRPDARPPDALPARPRPRLDRRPVRPRQDPRRGGREPRERSAASATSSGCGSSSTTTREVMLGQQRRVGASADWGRLRFTMDEVSAKAVRVAFERLYRDGPGLPDRGARQLVPGLPDQRQRPRGHPDAGDGHALDGPLPPHRRGDRRAEPDASDQRRDDPPRDDPRRHRGRRPPRRRALRGARRAAASGSRSSSATCRSSPTRRSIAAFGTGAVKITPAHDRTTTRPASATAWR